jgi:hypothetical protein
MKRIFTFLLLLSIGTFASINAKQPEKKEHNLIIFGVPQYIITNGLRVDLDIHKKDSPHWLIISPYYYFDRSSVDLLNLSGSEDYYDPYSYDQMIGVGLGFGRKTFLSKEPVSKGVYLYYGADYKYFDIDGNNYTWVEYIGTDDLPYQQMDNLDYTMKINSIAASACIGYQNQILSSLYLDLYLGFGVKYAFHNSPQHVTTKYNRGSNDYGYTGTHLVGGIRLGIGL